jgi:hypothetical protein
MVLFLLSLAAKIELELSPNRVELSDLAYTPFWDPLSLVSSLMGRFYLTGWTVSTSSSTSVIGLTSSWVLLLFFMSKRLVFLSMVALPVSFEKRSDF